jgi:Zn-dependent protease with chaperone function
MSLRAELPAHTARARRRVAWWCAAILAVHGVAAVALLAAVAFVGRRPVGVLEVAALVTLTLALTRVLRSFDPLTTSSRTSGTVCTATAEPELFAVVASLARGVGVAAPRRVLLDPGVTAHVTFDLAGRANDLTLGLGLVHALTRSELEAVIAHELRHVADDRSLVWRLAHAVMSIPTRRLLGDARGPSQLSAAVLGWCFSGFFRAYVALRRQGELEADAAAVAARGSDAIVHALVRMEVATEALALAMEEAFLLAGEGVFTDDLYVHQEAAAGWLRVRLGRPTWGVAPALAESPARRVLAFRAAPLSPAWVWREHPEPFERERVAKDPYVRAPLDDRPAWSLFARPEALRMWATEHWWRQTLADGPGQLTAAKVAQQRLSAAWAEATPPDDPAAWPFPVRWIVPGGEGQGLPPPPSTMDDAALDAAVAKLRAMDLHGLAERHAVATRDLATLEGIGRGTIPVEGGRFSFRGEEVALWELPTRLKRLADERLALRREWHAHDAVRYAVTLHLARRLDPGDEALLVARYRFQVQLQAALDELERTAPTSFSVWSIVTEGDGRSLAQLSLRNAWGVVEVLRARLKDVSLPPLDTVDGRTPLPELLLGPPLRSPELVADLLASGWLQTFLRMRARARAVGERLLAKNLANLLGQQSALLAAHPRGGA